MRTDVLTNERSSQDFLRPHAAQRHLGRRDPQTAPALARAGQFGGLLLLMLGLLGAGCLPDPQRLELGGLFDRLLVARSALGQSPPRTDATCDDVADVKSHLAGEPGLEHEQPAWSALRASTDALQAVCGQATLLEQPYMPTATLSAARARWQAALERELGVACDHLRQAADALGRGTAC